MVVAGSSKRHVLHVEALQSLTEQRTRIALGSKGNPSCRVVAGLPVGLETVGEVVRRGLVLPRTGYTTRV